MPEAKGDMGVTANAVLLLGYLYARFAFDDTYVSVSADTKTGSLIIRHRRSGNLHRISVVQAGGSEYAPEPEIVSVDKGAEP